MHPKPSESSKLQKPQNLSPNAVFTQVCDCSSQNLATVQSMRNFCKRYCSALRTCDRAWQQPAGAPQCLLEHSGWVFWLWCDLVYYLSPHQSLSRQTRDRPQLQIEVSRYDHNEACVWRQWLLIFYPFTSCYLDYGNVQSAGSIDHLSECCESCAERVRWVAPSQSQPSKCRKTHTLARCKKLVPEEKEVRWGKTSKYQGWFRTNYSSWELLTHEHQ